MPSLSYEDFGKPGDVKARATPSQRWWKLEEGTNGINTADAISARVKYLQYQQSSRVRQCIISARLYGNATMLGVSGFSAAQMATPGGGSLKEGITDNVVQSVIDTATARIGENKPRPYFITSGGSYKLQRRAKRLNNFVEGIFFEQKAYELGGEAQRDCEIFGDGLIHVGELNGRVKYTRVLSAEVWIDEAEGLWGRPREAHWQRVMDRDEAMARWPKKANLIAAASKAPLGISGSQSQQADLIVVVESWHLPSGEGAGDGKHVLSIDNGVLMAKTWEHDAFPFARFKWGPRPLGYWSQGLAEQLQSKQIEINKILWVIQRSMHLAGTFKVFLQMGSKIAKEHVSNDVGTIVEYMGTPPQYFVPQVVPGEYYQHLQTLIQSCYERAGVSLQSATGTKPAGLNSGEAQRVYRDTVAERLKTQERLNERGYMELAALSIQTARDIAKKEGEYVVESIQKRMRMSIRMTASELEDKDHDLQCFPTSSLPRDPAGRLQTIQEYIQAGFMSPRQGRRALDFPDLDAIESLANAEEDLLTKILDAICDGEEVNPPEPTDDLQLAKELVTEYINRGRMLELDEETLAKLRAWSLQVDGMQQAAQAAMAPPPGAMPMGGAPQANPMAPPTSDLIPNAPMAH